ncbi:MAG TPA: dephospho-CoA kinase [Acidimicrobiales bacterium]|nr:dephospho-CoA kinase [Acidimicrobiales bacterium]
MAPLVVGLTGGIGSGKSTVCALLAERGAVVIDADRIARRLQAPGGALYQPMIDMFGEDIVCSDGSLDRPAIAEVVFNDAKALKELNALTHPAIAIGMATERERQEGTDNIVILDIPLLVEGQGRPGLAAVIVVDCPVGTQIARLVDWRGMDKDDAIARIQAQSSRDERLARADFVIDNSGSIDELTAEIDRCWEWLQTLQP